MNSIHAKIICVLVLTGCFLSCDQIPDGREPTFSPSDKIIALRSWRSAAGDDVRWSKPDFDDAGWELVDVPDIWIARDLPPSGIVWYRKWINVAHTDSSEEASLWIKGIINAGEVYWDGRLVGRHGIVGRTGEPEIAGKGRYLPVLLGNKIDAGRHLIALRIANSQVFSGGFEEVAYSGSFAALLQHSRLSNAIFAFLIGIFILSGIHLLMLFAGDRIHREYLYFALLSFISAAFVLLVEISDVLGLALEYAMTGKIATLLILSLPVMMYFFLSVYFHHNVRWLGRMMVVITGCLALMDLLPVRYLFHYPAIIKSRDIWIQLAFCVSLYVAGWAVWKRKTGSRTLVAGVVAVAIGAIASFSLSDSLWGFSGDALFIVMMTISLSRHMSLIQREVRNTRDIFRLFVPEPVLDRIAKRGLQSIHLGGAEEGIATILFIDIKSFTSVAERLSPNQTLDFLNAFMCRMEPIINARGGFINQFVGDEIMAIFHRPGHGVAAIDASLAMRRELDSHNAAREALGLQPIEMGIGMNTGGIIWGTIGSQVRMDSAVIGDPVNLASRLQSLTRQYGVLILASEHTVHHIPDMSGYAYREVDIVQVKGKKEAVAVYEFFDGDPEPVRSQKRSIVDPFMQGIVRYRANEWDNAEALFARCLATCPGDSVARMYVDRCRAMRGSPPGATWGGITVHDRK